MLEFKNSFKIKNQGYKMSGFQPAITIIEALDNMQSNEYLLPAFQRRYTWDTEQIERLFDSILKGYPINSMLFWRVKNTEGSHWKFYEFLRNYREQKTTNTEVNSNSGKDFIAVLDGQQRLTSLFLALRSTYEVHRKRASWENMEKNFKKCSFYFNLTQSQSASKNLDVEYEFLWIENEKTQEQEIYLDEYNQKWFLCKAIHNYISDDKKSFKFYEVMKKLQLEQAEFEKLELFYQKMYVTPSINFYLEENSNPDRAVDIFTRINSGGTNLTFADILFSFAVANWQNGNFREKVDEVLSNLDFNISVDFILKTCLFLFHKEIRFQINSFNKDFVKNKIEDNWDKIVECIYATNKMLKTFGFDDKTLGAKNLIMPIIYFIYHNDLSNKINGIGQENNRKKIKLWILRAIACRAFSSSSDTVLASMRKAFTSNIDECFFSDKCLEFPSEKIENEANYIKLTSEDLENKLSLRKDNAETFTILSLLYPNLNTQNEFDKDHLHPFEACAKIKELDVNQYDSIVNLQMLEKSLNRSKKNQPLEDWVKEKCGDNREKFLEEHLIPDVDLSIDNFTEFYKKRKQLLISKLKKVLGMKQDDETGDNK